MSILDQGRAPSYLRPNNPADEDPLNVGARAALNLAPDQRFNDSSELFEEWSPEKQRRAFEGLQREDAKRIALDKAATDFVTLHPEYVDNNSNGKKMNDALVARHGNRVFTVEEFEQEYRVLRANNNLTLDQATIVKQQQAAANQRAKAERSRIVYRTEEELETMPLEEIRRLDAVERQKQMQRVGEEGGIW